MLSFIHNIWNLDSDFLYQILFVFCDLRSELYNFWYSYLEAYNKAKAISDVDGENSKRSSNASLVDEYNASKRSVSLLQKHHEKGKHPRKKSKQPEKEEWVGAHPWKPWDRETDLSAGRKKVNLDSNGMAQGLTSRFSSGPTQRNFLWARSSPIWFTAIPEFSLEGCECLMLS